MMITMLMVMTMAMMIAATFKDRSTFLNIVEIDKSLFVCLDLSIYLKIMFLLFVVALAVASMLMRKIIFHHFFQLNEKDAKIG